MEYISSTIATKHQLCLNLIWHSSKNTHPLVKNICFGGFKAREFIDRPAPPPSTTITAYPALEFPPLNLPFFLYFNCIGSLQTTHTNVLVTSVNLTQLKSIQLIEFAQTTNA